MYKSSMYASSQMWMSQCQNTLSPHRQQSRLWNVAFDPTTFELLWAALRTALIWVGYREHPSSLLPLSQPCARLELRARSCPLCAMWHFLLNRTHCAESADCGPQLQLRAQTQSQLGSVWFRCNTLVIRLVDYFLQRRSQAHMLVPVWCTIRCKPLVVMALSNAVHSFTQTHTWTHEGQAPGLQGFVRARRSMRSWAKKHEVADLS